jgi:class 3 adenylate cyclase
MFTDIVGATSRAVVREQIARFQGREIDTVGDGFLATFEAPARAVRCACAVVREVRHCTPESVRSWATS